MLLTVNSLQTSGRTPTKLVTVFVRCLVSWNIVAYGILPLQSAATRKTWVDHLRGRRPVSRAMEAGTGWFDEKGSFSLILGFLVRGDLQVGLLIVP
jgi:hypothetical protein